MVVPRRSWLEISGEKTGKGRKKEKGAKKERKREKGKKEKRKKERRYPNSRARPPRSGDCD
jgi:hypothetical protein